MPYEMSYDQGSNPFNHDKTKEKWSRPSDFIFACIGHAFKVDSIFIVTSYFIIRTGFYGLLMYILVTATCVMPIIFLQSFLGQFSSTGFISVFRISPLFKGIGFTALVLNLATLTYYSIFAAVPLFFFFNTLRPTIPWSCEGIKSWLETDENVTTPCSEEINVTSHTMMDIPSIEFFKYHINTYGFENEIKLEGVFSWSLLMCTTIVWLLVGVLMTRSLDVISKFLRYACFAVGGIICLLVIRFIFLPGAFSDLTSLHKAPLMRFAHAIHTIPFVTLATLGPGWGSTLTMASFNKFKANIFDSSWIICLAHFGIIVGLSLMTILTGGFLRRANPRYLYFQSTHAQWIELLMVPSALTLIGLTRILTLLFLSMVIVGCISLIVVQLLSVLTSLFDEYPRLRPLKKEVTVGLIGLLALISVYFCSTHGIYFYSMLSEFFLVTQTILNLLLLLVVLWIYGREKFQRDLQFMTGGTYPTWMVNVVRFVAPIFLCLVLLISIFVAVSESIFEATESAMIVVAFVLFTIVPWLLIPGYCIYKTMQTNGVLKARLQRGLRPTDWFPADPEDRQSYDELFNKTEITHQLTTNME